MSAVFTPEQRQKLQEVFSMFDKDNSGAISTSEISQIMKTFNFTCSEDDVNELIKRVDKDSSGEVDFEEFLQMMANTRATMEEEIRSAFEVFDADGNGLINKDELRATLQLLGEEAGEELITNMMEFADSNKDGYIDYTEFMKVIVPSE
eukprot:TRINITY_DN11383_c0_g1_i1.p1 TRINITY_DN11383_c0_g1~~TRINITY_DN11383_c0_g1_i1.p1  ORF type:complete len:149 (-),score=35.69 TRINITY_DN11383_c0_g1_i1:188-634(-)